MRRNVKGAAMGLDTVELVMGIERHFQVDIPDQDAGKMATVGDIHVWLRRELHRRELEPSLSGPSARVWSNDEIWTHLQRLVTECLDVPLEAVRPAAHIVHDLGAD